MPFAIGSIFGASQSDTLAVRYGRNVLVVGLGMVAVGITAVWMVLALCPPTQYNGWQLMAPLLVAGIGSGLFIAPNASFIVATVERADAGAASGVGCPMQRLGSPSRIAGGCTVPVGTLPVVP